MPDVESTTAGRKQRSDAWPWVHDQAGNNRDDIPVRFTVITLCEPGKPMLTVVDDDELVRREDRRVQSERKGRSET